MNADETTNKVEGEVAAASAGSGGNEKKSDADTAPAPAPPAAAVKEEQGGGVTRLYVGNLAWSVTSEELRDRMSRAGDVLSADVLSGRDGRSRGCGVVEYVTSAGADRAVAELQDTEIG